ncbi:MAG: redox-sensing transcriptional repressor Rex [Christensenellales bacterium]
MEKKTISEAVVKRLPKYYRAVRNLYDQNVTKISSSALAQMLGITASQVRQDFCNFGGFGQQGYGYDVAKLKQELATIMGLNCDYNVVIIGAGNIGRALGGYQGFEKYGFKVTAMFDSNPVIDNVGGIKVYNMSQFDNYVANNKTDMAVIATPKSAAQSVADKIISCGIKSIWNFAPIDLDVPDDVSTENISMSESLLVLSYRTKNKN